MVFTIHPYPLSPIYMKAHLCESEGSWRHLSVFGFNHSSVPLLTAWSRPKHFSPNNFSFLPLPQNINNYQQKLTIVNSSVLPLTFANNRFA